MNYQRILRVATGFFQLTGYQIRGLDTNTGRFRLSLWSVLGFINLFLIYLICFEQQFEKSAMMKIIQDLSPFLKNLVHLQTWLGLKAFLFCIIEWRSVTRVLNGLVAVLRPVDENKTSSTSDKLGELLAYVMLFSTLLVAICIGLYIAIEMKFELPPIGHIMIGGALFIPHFALASSLRLHNISMWFFRNELANLKQKLSTENEEVVKQNVIVIEIVNPVFKADIVESKTADQTSMESYREILNGVESISNYLKKTNIVLQRQMAILNALNFNCLIHGVYSNLYFQKTWNVVFFGRNRRVFYAANSATFVCIFMDYMLLFLVQFAFNKMKQNMFTEVSLKIKNLNNDAEEKRSILKDINRILGQKLRIKLFGLMDLNLWNGLILQGLMFLAIAIIVFYQYFSDQIVALTQQLEGED